MYTLKLLIIYSLLCSIVLLPVSVFSADTQEDFDAAASRITTIQATDPTLPNTAGDQKGSIGYVLSRLFDANGKIGNVFLKFLGTRSNNAVLRWSGGDTGQFVEGSITDTGTNVGIGTTAPTRKLDIAGDINFTGDLYKNGVLVEQGGGAINDLSDAKKNGSSLFLGDSAGLVDDGANANIGIGFAALSKNVSTINNIGIGFAALRDNIGNNNVAIGRNAVILNTTGNNNTALGSYALDASTTVSNTVAVGYAALTNNTTGANNTALGYTTLAANTTGNNNTALGYVSLDANTSGGQNTGVGYATISSNTTGIYNTALGYNALSASTTADRNTAIGGLTLDANTTGENNTALGYNALSANTTARDNVALGAFTLDANTTGENNTAVGYASLTTNTTGFDNTALGSTSLDAITTGSRNTGVGRAALGRLTTGVNNTALGIYSLDALTTGNDNTGIGYDALGVLTTGNNNVALGDNAGDNITTGSNNIIIGANIDAPSATESNQVNINDLIYGRNGNVGVGTGSPASKLDVNGDIRGNTVATTCVGSCPTSAAPPPSGNYNVAGDLNVSGNLTAANFYDQTPIIGTALKTGTYVSNASAWSTTNRLAQVVITVPAGPARKYRLSAKAMYLGINTYALYGILNSGGSSLIHTYEYGGGHGGWENGYIETFVTLPAGTHTFYLQAYGGSSYIKTYHANIVFTNIIAWPLQ